MHTYKQTHLISHAPLVWPGWNWEHSHISVVGSVDVELSSFGFVSFCSFGGFLLLKVHPPFPVLLWFCGMKTRRFPNDYRHVVVWVVFLSVPDSVWQCQSRENPNRDKICLWGLWDFLSHSGLVGSIWPGWVVCHPVLHGSVSSSWEVSNFVCPNTFIHLLHSYHHTPLTRQEPIRNRGFKSLCLPLSFSLFFPSLSLVILTKVAVCFSFFHSCPHLRGQMCLKTSQLSWSPRQQCCWHGSFLAAASHTDARWVTNPILTAAVWKCHIYEHLDLIFW